MLPRRNRAWQAHRCRARGKAVIVRIGKLASGPLKGLGWQQVGTWSRKAVTLMVLLVSLSALVLIVEAQYGSRWRASAEALASIPEASAAQEDSPAGSALTAAQESRYRAVSEFVARRYRVSQGVA